MLKKIIFSLLVISFISQGHSQTLKRKGSLGYKMQPINPEMAKELKYKGEAIALVKQVFPNTTASSLGIREDDILEDIGGLKVGPGFLNKYMSKFREGDKITATVFRKGKRKKLNGKVVGEPKEIYNNAEVIYDEVDFDNGKLRSIVLKPKNSINEKLPVIYYIQGYTCTSIEQIGPYSNSSLKQLFQGFLDKGYIVYRIEKLGMGDSTTENHCLNIDAGKEIEGFRAGLKDLQKYTFVDQENIFIWGHSLGGGLAAFVAEDMNVKGIIGYGFVVKSWHDYIYDILTSQLPLTLNVTYGQMYDFLDDCRAPLYDFFYNNQTIESIIKKYPNDNVKSLFSVISYNDKNKSVMGRSQDFLKSLNDLKLIQKHQDIKVPTLGLYGASDLAAIGGDVDVINLARAINEVAPGNGYYNIIQDTNHFLAKVGDVYANAEVLKSKQMMSHAAKNFNSEIVEVTHDWISQLINK